MTNLFQDIFGGSTTQSILAPINMNPLTSALAPGVTGAFNGAIAGGAPQYNGPLTTGTTPTENTLMGNIAQTVAPNNPTNTLINQAGSGAFLPGGQYYNPFVSQSITAATNPIYQQLSQTEGQNIPAQFVAGGQQVQGGRLSDSGQAPGSTAFTNAEAIATESANQAAATAAASVENNAFNTGVGATTAIASLQPQEVQAMVNGLQANLLPTLLTEQGITNGLQAFQENVGALTSFLTTLSSAITPVVGNQQTSNTTSTPGILPDIAGLVGASSGSNNNNKTTKA